MGTSGETVMRIPDEGKCDKSTQLLVEDRVGYRLCSQCINCTLNKYDTIYTDGAFYCFYYERWKKGDDVIEYMCRGYTGKACYNCKKRFTCQSSNPDSKEQWCNKYKNMGITYDGIYYYGRRRSVNKRANKQIVKLEEKYINAKRADYQRKRAEEDREYQQDKERNAELGSISLPYSDKEDKVTVAVEEGAESILSGEFSKWAST